MYYLKSDRQERLTASVCVTCTHYITGCGMRHREEQINAGRNWYKEDEEDHEVEESGIRKTLMKDGI